MKKQSSLKLFGLSALGGAGITSLLTQLRPSYTANMPKPMKVSSSTIDAVSYDPKTRSLVVIFKTGKKYKYDNVSKQKFRSFMAAPSKNTYLRKSIATRSNYEKIASDVRTPLAAKKPKSLSTMLDDLRHIDTPEKWKRYVEQEQTSSRKLLGRDALLHDKE